MPRIGQKFFEWLLQDQIVDGAGARTIEVHEGKLHVKVWGVITDSVNYVLNGLFATDTDWIKGTGWTIANDLASSDASQTGDSDLTQTPAVALVDGEVYEVTFAITGQTAGNVTPVVGDQEGTDRAADGVYIEEITAGAGTDIDIRADLDFDGDISGISVVRKSIGWDGATVNILVRAEDGVTWLVAASKTADFIGTIDLGSGDNEFAMAEIASAGNKTKLSCTVSR